MTTRKPAGPASCRIVRPDCRALERDGLLISLRRRGIAHAGDRTITAWRRDLDIFLAEPGRPETRLGKGHDVALAATKERTYVLWVENSELISWIDGRIETLAPKAAMPAIAVLPNGGALAAWEADGGISVATLK